MTKPPPFAHQARELELFRDEPARGLFWRMRTGKSRAMCDLMEHLWSACEIDAVLIVAPPEVHENWIDVECPTHLEIPWRGHAWRTSAASAQWHRERLTKVLTPGPALNILALPTKSLFIAACKAICKRLYSRQRVLLIVDEAHDFRAPGSQKSKRIRAVAQQCPYKRILTGTPVAEDAVGLWSMLEILGPGASGFMKFPAFKRRFFKETIYSRGRKAGSFVRAARIELELTDEAGVRDMLAKIASVVTRKDCPDLPPVMLQRRYVYHTDDQWNTYEAVRREEEKALSRLRIDFGSITKLQQINSGFVLAQDRTEQQLMPHDENPRMQALAEELEGDPGKVIVWATFQWTVREVAAHFRKHGGTLALNGLTPTAERAKIRTEFQHPKGPRILVCNPAVGGLGFDMSIARKQIWFEPTWKWVLRDQASERCTKMHGEPTDVIDFVTPGTVDTRILDVLARKQDVEESVSREGLKARLQELLAGGL